MRILWWSNPPFLNTGYGKITKKVIELLQRDGHEVAVASISGLSGNSIEWNGVPLLPMRGGALCVEMIHNYAKWFGAEAVISLYDVWTLPKGFSLDTFWVAWTPVDGKPLPQRSIDVLENVDHIVAFSRFGEREIRAAGLGDRMNDTVSYIPLGVDTDVFCPGNVNEARARLNISPDRFVVAMVAANKGFPPRKSWPEALWAFAQFVKRAPDALLYLHTTRKPFGTNEGVNLPELVKAFNLQGNVVFADETEMAVGVDDVQMADIYRAADVLLSPSMGEGFGLPIVEAQACGTPVITTIGSSMTELTFNGMMTQSYQPMWIPQLGYWWDIADRNSISHALRTAFQHGQLFQRSAEGVEQVQIQFSWDRVWELYWRPFLAEVESWVW